MKTLILLFPLLLFLPANAQEIRSINLNKACAAMVGIPYASDNFTDEEWKQFQNCLAFLKKYQQNSK